MTVPPDGKTRPQWRTEPPKLPPEKSTPSAPFALASDLTAASVRITTLETMLNEAIASIIQLQTEVKDLAGGDAPEAEAKQGGEGDGEKVVDGEAEEDDVMLDMGDGDGSETRAVEAQVIVEVEGVDEGDEVLEDEEMEEYEEEEEEEEVELPEQQAETADKVQAVVEPVRKEEDEVAVETTEVKVQEEVPAETVEQVDGMVGENVANEVQPEAGEQPEMEAQEETAASQAIMAETEQETDAQPLGAEMIPGNGGDLLALDAANAPAVQNEGSLQADHHPSPENRPFHEPQPSPEPMESSEHHRDPSPPLAGSSTPPLPDDQSDPTPTPGPERETTPPHVDNDPAPSPPSVPTPAQTARPLSPSISPPKPQARYPSPPLPDSDQRDPSPAPETQPSPRSLSPSPDSHSQPVALSSSSLLPSAPIQPAPTLAPLEIHIAHSHLFGPLPITYNSQYTFYRCTICAEPIRDVKAHFQSSGIHGTSFTSSSHFFEPLLAALPEGDPYARLPPRLSASNPLPVHIPGIPSTSGYTCTICNFVGVTYKSIKGHIGEEHGMTAGTPAATEASLPFAPCKNLQRFWNDKSAKWFPSSKPAHGGAQRAGSVVRGASASVGGTPVASGRVEAMEASGSQAPRLPSWNVGPSSQIPPIAESQQPSSSQIPASQFPPSQLAAPTLSMTDEARLLKQVAETKTRNEALSKRVDTIMQHNAKLRTEKEAMRVKQLETQKKLEEVEKRLKETEKELEAERKISADIAAAAKFAKEQEEEEGDELEEDVDEVDKEGDARGGKRKRVDPPVTAARVKPEPRSRSVSARPPAAGPSAAPPTPRSTTASGSGAGRGASQARAMSRVSQSVSLSSSSTDVQATPRANSKRPLSPSVSPVRQTTGPSAPTPSPSPTPTSTAAFIAAALGTAKPTRPTWSTNPDT